MDRPLLLDFYGTLVAEDEARIAEIEREVASRSGRGATEAEVRSHWSRAFARICAAAHGPDFRSQREIEIASLAEAARKVSAVVDVEALAARLFAYWAAPSPLAGSAEFLREYRGPICVVSNIDGAELRAAIAGLGWSFDHVITSEDCRAYKPRAEMFRAALAALGCAASDALHVGDSLGSDVAGARSLGIEVAWVNAADRPLPDAHTPRPTHTIRSVAELPALLSSPRSTRR